jgi:type I restriction-modification system DNA methylase subunit
MRLYAYSAPDIAKHDGYLKIGETHRSTDTRIHQQGGQVNVEKVPIWQDAIAAERQGIDRLFRHFLRDKYGFHIQPNISGHGESEWVQCTVEDIKEAFPKFKELFFQEQKEREIVSEKFYEEIRNWFYWTTQENQKINADYALRLVVRLLFCFFLREKDALVPKELLDANIEKHLKSDEEYSYYNGILRNLFFHCLNTPDERKYENEKLLADKKEIKGWFSTIPFLNGGLFDEHDKDDIPIGNDYFFSEKRNRHLSELGETCNVYGIVTILSKYQYKLTLDDLLDQAEYGKTVDPEFIGKVFESLLSCIDAENQKTRQKITGSYYTPREIVEYMINEALDAYLKTNNDLLQCKILDPACGSGAFPCEAMNIILHRVEEEKKNNDDKGFSPSERYRTKLKIVQDVIYGVDIQPIAVQITLLRFFLSLIQDIVPDKNKRNYGIDPLPNLEMKFVCADTLIPLVEDKKDQAGMYQHMLGNQIIRNTAKLLKDNRDQYFMASMIQRKQEIQQTDKTLRETLALALEGNGMITHEATKRMAAWNPFNQSQPANFFDSVWMFGIETFDIVIGNPPYGAKYPEAHENIFKKLYSSAQTIKNEQKGSLDTFTLFIENGFNSLKKNGYLTFIVPLTVISSDSMTALHHLLEEHCSVIQAASFCDRPQQIFRHSHKKTTIIGFLKDNQQNKQILATQMYRKDKETPLEDIIKSFKFTNVKGLGLRGRYAKISLPIEKRILKKFFAQSHTPVRDLIDENGSPIYYRSTGGMYYNVITNKTMGSTKEKSLYLDKRFTDVIGAVLSSSLFWWYQQVYSNGLELKSYEIESLPIPVKRLTPAVRRKIESLYKKYLRNIERHVIEHETEEYKHVTKYKEYKIRYSKALIDAMDDVICPLYGLTEEECEFIKNYELRFRIDE